MRHGLLLDIQGAQSPGHRERGIPRYVTRHADALMRRSDRVRGLLLSPFLPFPGNLPGEMISSTLLRWNTAAERAQRHAGAPVAYHVMSPFELHDPTTGVVPTHLMSSEIPLIVTLYDLVPYFWPQHYLSGAAWAKRYKQRLELVRGADLVLAVSDATRADAIREMGIAPERIVTIGGGVERDFEHAATGVDGFAEVSRAIPAIRGRYVFSVGAPDWRKNTERLVEAFATVPREVRRHHQLVITCQLSDAVRTRWMEHARAVGLVGDEMVLTGRVDEATLIHLYQAAALFVFPSLYEGFGLPVVEAIACGVPAITSNNSSLPEILDHPPATFDPEDVNDMARVLERGIGDAGFRAELSALARTRAPLFQWDLVADRTIAALDAVIDGGPRARRGSRRRLRVALATPIAPDSSTVATYNARLIPHLAQHLDLDVLYPDLGRRPTVEWPGVTCLPIEGLGRFINPHSYDAIVYAIGDDAAHVPTYEAALRFPGIVWFHDVKLARLYWAYAARLGISAHEIIREQVRRFYAKRAPEHAVQTWTVPLVARYGLNLTPEMVQRARHVIVPSPVAARSLRLDQGGDVRCPDVSIMPCAASPCRAGGPITRVQPAIVGIVGARTDAFTLLQDALALIPDGRRPDVAPGDVPFDSLTCGVHLCDPQQTQTSAGVREALAAGLPVISNAAGVDEEFPAGTLLTMPNDGTSASLAAQIDMLCRDRHAWQSMSSSAWLYSRTLTTEEVAVRLANLIETTVAGWGVTV